MSTKPKKIGFKFLEIKQLSDMNTLVKLRLTVMLIFILSTIAIISVFVSEFVISVVLVLISYLLVVILMVKLLLIKKL